MVAMLSCGVASCQGASATPDDTAGGEPAQAAGIAGSPEMTASRPDDSGIAESAKEAAIALPREAGAASLGAHVYPVFEQELSAPVAGYANPWEDVAIDATFTSPSGRSIAIGGFYDSGSTYKARFLPDEAGTWKWTAIAKDTQGGSKTSNGSFDAVPDGSHGFIRKSTDNPNRWKYEDGTTYYGVGLQSCMPKVDGLDMPGTGYCGSGTGSEPGHPGLWLAEGKPATLDTFLSVNAEGGFNLFRWASYSVAPGLWKTISPKGNVYAEAEGKYGDRVKSTARKYGYSILFTLFTYWEHRPPYFESPSLADDEKGALQRYLQYVINRYAAYVDIWEAINEGNGSAAWYAAVIPYLREHDPYKHDVTTSTVFALGAPEYASGITVNMMHWYAPVTEDVADQWTFDNLQHWKTSGQKNMVGSNTISGETGNCCKVCNYGPTGFRLRNWTSFFAEGILIYWDDAGSKTACGTANTNYYIGDEERASTKALAAFTRGFDPKAKMASDFVVSGATLRGHSLSGPVDYALYLVNANNHASPTSGAKVTVSPQAAGHAIWVDPSTGTLLGELDVPAGSQALDVPSFTTDIALKIHAR
jgi:hypothetical protein